MEGTYHQPQPYHPYGQPRWPSEFKPNFGQPHPMLVERERNMVMNGHIALPNAHTQPGMKVEDEMMEPPRTWHDARHTTQQPQRHHSQPAISVPYPDPHNPQYVHVDPRFAASYAHPQAHQWTTVGAVPGPQSSFGGNVGHIYPPEYNFGQDPMSTTSMSPESSVGGWQSATSTESVEQKAMLTSPSYCPVSPQLVQRPDGIRKKNARFEIPRERNLQTIDALIASTTDDTERKELKSQKRLLRNRQAA